MEAWLSGCGWLGWAWLGAHWGCALLGTGMSAVCWWLRLDAQKHARAGRRERSLREELQAYARLDVSITRELGSGMDAAQASRLLARRVCRTIAEKSAFRQVGMLLRNAEGRLRCFGSAGADDTTVACMQEWAEKIVEEEHAEGRTRTVGPGTKNVTIALGEWGRYDYVLSPRLAAGQRERRRWRRAIVTPIWASGNAGTAVSSTKTAMSSTKTAMSSTKTAMSRMTGAIIVCADASAEDEPGRRARIRGPEPRMGAIEALASRLGTSIENRGLTERLLRAEKLASLGQLAGGVAHALNNPLTAVLGFAELIRETSDEQRVRQDAETIVAEALKMKDTVQRLIEFWRPVAMAQEQVDLSVVVRELVQACEAKLQERGVLLQVAMPGNPPLVRGSRERLRQVLEHLLNNAAQAIALQQSTLPKKSAMLREPDLAEEPPSIRISLSHDEHALHVIVSDTGPGFKEPSRVFDPFYTTKGPEHGAGLGLSICYGIVREHGGEISALNMLPHGAAVVVELPLNRVVQETPACVEEAAEEQHVAARMEPRRVEPIRTRQIRKT